MTCRSLDNLLPPHWYDSFPVQPTLCMARSVTTTKTLSTLAQRQW